MSLFFSTGAIASSGVSSKPGMVLLTPTSIAHSGTSASIGANGQVTFTAVTSLSLNGVFSATYDNYVVSFRYDASAGERFDMRLRASGTDATGSNYTRQVLEAGSSTISASRATETFIRCSVNGTEENGHQLLFYGPFLAQPTAGRTFGVGTRNPEMLVDNAWTHSLSTAYDGFTLIPASSNMTGAVQVYGLRS